MVISFIEDHNIDNTFWAGKADPEISGCVCGGPSTHNTAHIKGGRQTMSKIDRAVDEMAMQPLLYPKVSELGSAGMWTF